MAPNEQKPAEVKKPSIVYTGTADVRVMRKSDVEGLEKELVWNSGNNRSVSTEGLPDNVVEFLGSLPDFKVK